jgi:hypothetical protein
MRVRLIQLTTRRSGAQARHEEVREDDFLTIGRGTDNDVSLPGLAVSLHHAWIRRSGGVLRVGGLDGNVVSVNDRIGATHDLGPGDVVRIGSYELRLVEPGPGEDLALEIEEVERAADARDALELRTRLGVARGWLSKRRLVCIALVLVAGLAFALPWRAAHWSEAVAGPPEAPLARASVTAVQGWSVGPISAPHRQFEKECGRCHAQGFEAVRDQECLRCHAHVEAHAKADVSPRELDEMRCTVCHTEHRGVHGLSERQTGSCAPCHARLASLTPASKQAVASNFGTDHPEFRLTILKDPATSARERVTWTPNLQESTGLVFSHLRHVGQAVENRATGNSEYMRCDACHVPETSGKNHEPVRFETRCQSCHSLGFDLAFPEKQARHGDPVKMREELLGFYSAVAIGGLVPPGRGPAVLRAAPGRALTPGERRVALDWAREQANAATAFLMDGKDRCGMCHGISKQPARDGGEAIAAVQIPRTWLPHAKFSHRSHAPSACSACHPAITVFDPVASPELPRPEWAAPLSKPFGLLTPAELARAHPGMKPSEASSDVSIPDRDECRSCHLGPDARTGFIASSCGLCHGFHRPELGPMAGVDGGAR